MISRHPLGFLAPLALILSASSASPALTVDFEDVGLNLPIGGNFYYDGSDAAGGFTSNGVHFNNENPAGFFSGFAYSQTTDTTTPGFGNQWSAFPGSGAGASATYGLGFQFVTPTITLDTERLVLGAELTNTTYAALSMRDGDAFSKQFGGATGSDPDWFLLTIRGFDTLGAETGSIPFYLADFRFADGSLDYVVDSWTFVDLSMLGPILSLRFELSGSDTGEFGLNTPAYFAIDDLVAIPVPEPGSLALLGLGLLLCATRRGRPRGAR